MKPQHDRIRTICLWFVFIVGIIYILAVNETSYLAALFRARFINYTRGMDVRHGDFIFQQLPGDLLDVISGVTASRYNHCGIIIQKSGGYYVLEAVGPVKETPLNQWIAFGIGQKCTVVRLKDAYKPAIPAVVAAAYRYLGRPYDVLYEMDDRKIYCSELIYKASMFGAGIRLAGLKRLGDLNWRPYEDFIRMLAGGELPLERRMIVPHDLVLSEKVRIVYSSYRK